MNWQQIWEMINGRRIVGMEVLFGGLRGRNDVSGLRLTLDDGNTLETNAVGNGQVYDDWDAIFEVTAREPYTPDQTQQQTKWTL